jgi:TPR repeat protein
MVVIVITLVSTVLALAYFHGSTTCCDDAPSRGQVQQYEERARKGDAKALARLQMHYMNSSDKSNLKKWLTVGAELDDPESICQLFSFVTLGQLAIGSDTEREWLKEKVVMLATQGNAKASTLLGTEYAKGSILPLDAEAARFWLRKAATQNELAAIYGLAKLLIEKPAAPADKFEAIQLLEKLYQQSPPDSSYRDFATINLKNLTAQ